MGPTLLALASSALSEATEITLTIQSLVMIIVVIFGAGGTWVLLRGRIRRNGEAAEQALVRAEAGVAVAERAHRRLNEMETRQATAMTKLEGKMDLLASKVELVLSEQGEARKDIKHLMTKGCAIGSVCRARDDETEDEEA